MKTMNTIKKQHINQNEVIKKFLLDTIRNEHPDWVEENGKCAKCNEYYESLSSIVSIVGIDRS